MAARPRTHKIDIPNLYCKLDKRTNKVYWQYKNPSTGVFTGFGTDADAAKTAAAQLNLLHAENAVSRAFSLISRKAKANKTPTGLRLKEWVSQYIQKLEKRVERKDIAPTTLRIRKYCAQTLSARIPNQLLTEITGLEMAVILEEFTDADKTRMAQVMRASWFDLFKEAQYAGVIPPGFNPAEATRKPSSDVTRQRLTLDDWKAIHAAATKEYPPLANAMLLAVMTGQRIGDIVRMRFSDVWDDMLHIEQEKGGALVAIPLSLYCEPLGMSLRDAVAKCRDRVLSKYLVHHVRTRGDLIKAGTPVQKNTLSNKFSKVRDMAGITTLPGKTPPTFHEQRSLSERIYREQGINTQNLLGHSSQQTTDLYHDDRSKKWVVVAV